MELKWTYKAFSSDLFLVDSEGNQIAEVQSHQDGKWSGRFTYWKTVYVSTKEEAMRLTVQLVNSKCLSLASAYVVDAAKEAGRTS
jgi:hypothetical protein